MFQECYIAQNKWFVIIKFQLCNEYYYCYYHYKLLLLKIYWCLANFPYFLKIKSKSVQSIVIFNCNISVL